MFYKNSTHNLKRGGLLKIGWEKVDTVLKHLYKYDIFYFFTFMRFIILVSMKGIDVSP